MEQDVSSSPDFFGRYEYMMAFDVLQAVDAIMTDEDPSHNRDDLHSINWQDIMAHDASPDDDDYEFRTLAKNMLEFHQNRLLHFLHPELNDVTSFEEAMLATWDMPELNERSGDFRMSEYTTDDGDHRLMMFIQVGLGDEQAFVVSLIDGADDGRGYVLGVMPNGDIVGQCGDLEADFPDEHKVDYMTEQLPVSQHHNFQRVIGGAVRSYDLDMVLAEIRYASEAHVPAADLEEIIDFARHAYNRRVESDKLEEQFGTRSIRAEDVYTLQQIVYARLDQISEQ